MRVRRQGLVSGLVQTGALVAALVGLLWTLEREAAPQSDLSSAAVEQSGRRSVALTHWASETEALALIDSGGDFGAAATVRIGRPADWELAMRRDPRSDAGLVTQNFDLWANGVPVPFTLTFDGSAVVALTLTQGQSGTTVANVPYDWSASGRDVFVRTRAVVAGSSIEVSGLVLNGQALPEQAQSSASGTEVLDVLRIAGAGTEGGFTLTGTITMRWGAVRPLGAQLSAQFWVADAPLRPAGGYLWLAGADLLGLGTPAAERLNELAGETRAVAVAPGQRAVWSLAGGELRRHALAGTLEQAFATTLPATGRAALVVRGADGSVWAAAGSKLESYGAEGQPFAVVTLPAEVRSLSLSPDESLLWVATSQTVSAYDAVSGGLVRSLALGALPSVVGASADPLDGAVWVGLQTGLRRYAESGTLLAQASRSSVAAITADGRGGAWVLRASFAERVDVSLSPGLVTEPWPLAAELPTQLVAIAEDGSAWVAGPSLLAHIEAAGRVALRGQQRPALSTVSAAAFVPEAPGLVLVSPGPGAYRNERRPALTYEVASGGVAWEPSSVDVLEGGVPLAVDCQAIGLTQVQCLPAADLPEGLHTLTATVADVAGRVSSPATAVFTVDVTPPWLVAEQISVSESLAGRATVVGSAGATEPGVTVRLASPTQTTTLTATVDGSFGWSLAAEPSAWVTVVAEDRAGNRSSTASKTVLPPPPDPTLPPDPSTVAPPLDRTVALDVGSAVAFLYSGPNPIQTGVAAGTIDPLRAAVLRGRVVTDNLAALSGVTVSIVGHPEYGQTVSRQDGAWDLVVNGGGRLTVDFAKTGFLPSQRPVEAPLRDWAAVEDVVLVELDDEVTVVEVDASGFQVARSGSVGDLDGYRKPTLLFPPGLEAELVLPDGSRQALPALSVRATEYTVGANGPLAMPAPLPAFAGYTYAVELSADEAILAGAERVDFNQAVWHYVENFLGFPVGGRVPTGYYDRKAAVWVPSSDGRIVKVLAIEAGAAVLDVTGSGTPAMPTELEALGVTAGELTTLAGLYAVGAELWRVPISHFTPWDCNWPYVPPDDWESPPDPFGDDDDDDPDGDDDDDEDDEDDSGDDDPDAPHDPDEDAPPDPCADEEAGSILECQSQILREVIPLSGTPYRLHYGSDRVPGRTIEGFRRLRVTPPVVPASLKGTAIKIQVAGRTFRQSFGPEPDRFYQLAWDGVDGYGRAVQGSTPLTVELTYRYRAQYAEPGDFVSSFNRPPSGVRLGSDESRSEILVTRTFAATVGALRRGLGRLDFRELGLGGWTLSGHHWYDPNGRTVYFGDGRSRPPGRLGGYLARLTGTGQPDFSGDDGPARQAEVSSPQGLAVAADGSVYVADTGNRRVRKIDPERVITTVAGSGLPCSTPGPIGPTGTGTCGDGGPAALARLTDPVAVVVTPAGELYIADAGEACVRKVATDGTISTAVGRCLATDGGGGAGPHRGDLEPCAVGDLCVATASALDTPQALALDAQGGLLVADGGLGQVLHLGADGYLSVFAGGGSPPDGLGDGLAATQAALSEPAGLALTPDGGVLIADAGGERVRLVGLSGLITTFAGTGTNGDGGDGGPARQAQLSGPRGLAVGRDGSVYVTSGARVRKVDPEGTITLLAGGAAATPDGVQQLDGVAGRDIDLGEPTALALTASGLLAWVDRLDHVVEAIAPDLPGYSGEEIQVPDGSTVHVFDAQGRHLRTVLKRTGAVLSRFRYTAGGLLSEVEDAFGNVTRVERTGSGELAAIVGPYGERTVFEMSAQSYVSRVRDPGNQRAWSFEYNAGLLTRLVDPRNHTSEYEFDVRGRLVTNRDPAGGEKRLRRDGEPGEDSYTARLTTAEGRRVAYEVKRGEGRETRRRITTIDGIVGEFEITQETRRNDGTHTVTHPDGTRVVSDRGPDSLWGASAGYVGRRTTTTGGKTQTVTVQRDALLGDPADRFSVSQEDTLVQVNGRTFTSSYDGTSRTTTLTTPGGRSMNATADELGRTIASQVGGLAPVALGYDSRGRLETLRQGTGADERLTVFTYGPDGRLASLTDPLGRSLTFLYDSLGRISSQTLPDGRAIGFGFDPSGNLTSLTPPGKPAHSFGYTPVNLAASYTPPAAGLPTPTTSYQNDRDRRLTRQTRPDGSELVFTLDRADRLLSVASSRGTTNYTYRPKTRQVDTVTAPDGGTLGYGYAGRLLAFATWNTTAGGSTIAGSVGFAYDDDFRVIEERVNGMTSATFGYDDDGLLTSAGGLTLARSPANGLLTGTTLGSVTTSTGYNPFGEPTSMTASFGGSALWSVAYVRDKLGRLTEKTETLGGVTHSWVYRYDLAGRLWQVLQDGLLFAEYGYDPNGNRTSYAGTFGSAAGTHDDQDRLLSYGSTTYTYTANGELATKTQGSTTQTTTYGPFGELLGMTTPSGLAIEYVLDGANRRIGKKVNGVLVEGFLYRDALKPVAWLDGTGAVKATFVYGTKPHTPDLMVTPAATYRLLTDHLGSIRLVLDVATGTVAQRLDYDEFGRILFDSNPGFQPFGYAGGLYDAQTGLVRFGARDYDPEIGRWTSKDPIRFAGGDSNLYAYVGGDPVNLVDPQGTVPILLILWGAYEVGSVLWDAYQTYETFTDPCASDVDKALALGGLALDIFGPGGLLSKGLKIADEGLGFAAKAGRHGVDGGRKADIKFIDRVVNELGLNKEQRRLLHDEITGLDLSPEEIRTVATDILQQFPKGGRR